MVMVMTMNLKRKHMSNSGVSLPCSRRRSTVSSFTLNRSLNLPVFLCSHPFSSAFLTFLQVCAVALPFRLHYAPSTEHFSYVFNITHISLPPLSPSISPQSHPSRRYLHSLSAGMHWECLLSLHTPSLCNHSLLPLPSPHSILFSPASSFILSASDTPSSRINSILSSSSYRVIYG